MRRLKVILVAAMAIPLAGCLLIGKPKALPAAPAPPQPVAPATPQELSIPQTDVDLPPRQNDPDKKAFNTQAPVEPAPEVEPKPAPPQPAQQHVQHPPPVQAPKPVVETPPAEPSRPPIQEILPPDEEKRLQHSAEGHRAETGALLAVARRRHLTAKENQKVEDINQFLKQSEQAESNKDMRSADQLAERAYILAKELQGGR
jgi:hypothetical protein